MLERAGDRASADFVREHADFLESHIESWTVTRQGALVGGITRHYVRINPNADGLEDPDRGRLVLANQPPGGPYAYPPGEIVDTGFLELVRYGVRNADDPIVVDSLRVVDAVLKVDTPAGPCWKRYTHDGYGQRADGTSYKGWGVGRPWPLLTGERGHYELAAGRSPGAYLAAIENFAVGIGLIPEQIWDGDAIPDKLLRPGGPTGAALPLVWAHAEYIKLVRSAADGRVFDAIEPVVERYARRVGGTPGSGRNLEIWSVKRPIANVPGGVTLRVVSGGPFTLEWTPTPGFERETEATATRVSVWYVDLPTAGCESVAFRFVHGDGSLSDRYSVAMSDRTVTLSR